MGRTWMMWAAISGVFSAGCDSDSMDGMVPGHVHDSGPDMAMGAAVGPQVPPVNGFSEGDGILFIHTEASDSGVADMLTMMMGSPVLVVPALASVPAASLAPVYVFTNGITGGGPLGFQPDVFPSPPGGPGYTPLRELTKVTWTDAASARILKAASEVLGAEVAGEVTFERPGVVVNMPFVTWPGGQR